MEGGNLLIPDEFKAEAGVTFQCRNCNKKTTIPALRVVDGIKCAHCGSELEVTPYALALKAVLLSFASGRDDVKVD